ncbi:MAG TPA: hypothetical protein VK927_08950 [Adhaeribacter sp.]|nr:hypothetical protein [Adhaeribacter sp.]
MPKRYILYLFILALLGALGWYGFSKWTEAREKVNLWTLVPEDAVFVIESGNHDKLIDNLKRTQVWESLSSVMYFRRLEANLAMVDSLGGGRQNLYRFLDTKTILTSLHVINKTETDLVFYVPISTVKEHRFVRTLVENLEKNHLFTHTNHKYQGFLVTDLINETTGETFSYFTYKNNLVMSATPVLLEEIIRKIKVKRLGSVAEDFASINYLNQDQVYANVFINFNNLPPFLSLYLKPELRPDVEYLSSLCRNSMLEFKLANNKLFLNGFSNPQDLSQSFYQHIGGQKPKPLDLQQYLPKRTAVLLHFGVDKVTRLRQYSGKATERPASHLLFADSLGRMFDKELALCYLQTYNAATSPDKVIFAHSSVPDQTSALLTDLARRTSTEARAVPYLETYSGYSIRMVPVPAFPEMLFGRLFRGFRQSYYAQAGNYFIFTEDLATLRSVLSDISAENVWGKSVAQKAFLEETQHEANFSVFVNSVNSWQLLNRYVTKEKKETLLRNENMIKDFNQFSMQFGQVEKQYYTTLLLRQQDALAIEYLQADTFEIEKKVVFKSPLVHGPFAIKNPVNRGITLLVQDSALALHHVTEDGKIIWSDSLNDRIRGPIVQLPFGAGDKNRLLFATSSRIYSFERTGKRTQNFPYYLADSLRLQRLTVVDWSNDGRQELVADDDLGNLFVLNQNGEFKPGWRPRALEARLAAPPELYRIGSREVLLAVLENGYVYALQEDGEPYPGFPFSVRASVKSGAFGKMGASFSRSEFTLVTTGGEVITFDLTGEIRKRHQLVRPSKDASFRLVPENSGKTFLIVRQSLGRVSLFDPSFRLLLERNFITSSPKIVQYYLFGGDRIVYAITETGPGKTYLFDGKAQPIGDRLIENRLPVELYYNDLTNEYHLYKIFGKELKKITIRR